MCFEFGGSGIGNEFPVGWPGQGQGESGFEVGLVEAGEGHAGVHGHEEGVEIFVAVVAIVEAGDGFAGDSDVGGEFSVDGVFAGVE